MKKIKIAYVDFWNDLKKTDNLFYNILKKHYEVEISDKPDYVFCSCFGEKHFNYQDCVKIFFTGENIIPDFNLYDYAMGFHFIDFEDRYLRLPLYALYEKDIPLALAKHTHDDEYYLSRKKFCNRVVSNPYAAGKRDEMYKALDAALGVDSGGRYRNNVGGPVKDKIAFERQYRFTLAFENCSTNGYTTEKIFQAFAGDTVPIYWGSRSIKEEFNPESFIDCADYPDIPTAVEAIREIWEDDERYLKMMKAPMAPEGFLAAKYLDPDYAESFLLNIFEQDKKEAIRRSMVYIGRDYQKRLKDAAKLKKALNVFKAPMHMYKKTRAQILSKKIGMTGTSRKKGEI